MFIRLANYLAENGTPVCLIVNNGAGPLRSLLSDLVMLKNLGASKALFALPSLVSFLKKQKPHSLVAVMTRTNLAGLVAARIAGTGTRVIVCERNQYSVLVQTLDPLRRWVMNFLVRRLYPTAAMVIGNTTEVTQDIAQFAQLDASKTSVIPNPAPDLTEIKAVRQHDVPHPWLDEPFPVAIAIGRLMPQKDYPTMLAALARTEPKLRLLVLGDGPERERLASLAVDLGIGDRVQFLGFQMNRLSYLVRADLFLMSSLTEGFPNALIEAIAAEVDAICTDFAGGGAREIMGAEFPDRIVPVGDATALSAAIRTFLQNRADRDRAIDRKLMSDILQRYKIETIAEALLDRSLS